MRLGSSLSRGPRGRALARFEVLEDRQCLSATVTTIALDGGGNRLKIVDDTAASTVNIVDQGNGHIDVTDGDGALLGSADDVRAVRFEGKAGADVVNYSLTGPLTNTQKIVLALGAGADTANVDLSQGIVGAKLQLSIEGGAGKDAVGLVVGNLDASQLAVTFDGGDGADSIDVTVGNLVSSRVDLDLAGDDGADTINVIAQAVTIDAQSVLRANVAGGDGKDALSLNFDGVILGKLNYQADGGAGVDTLTGQVTAAPGSVGILRTVEFGAKGVDNVTLNVTDNSGEDASTLAKLRAKIFNPGLKDTVVSTDNVKVANAKPKA